MEEEGPPSEPDPEGTTGRSVELDPDWNQLINKIQILAQQLKEDERNVSRRKSGRRILKQIINSYPNVSTLLEAFAKSLVPIDDKDENRKFLGKILVKGNELRRATSVDDDLSSVLLSDGASDWENHSELNHSEFEEDQQTITTNLGRSPSLNDLDHLMNSPQSIGEDHLDDRMHIMSPRLPISGSYPKTVPRHMKAPTPVMSKDYLSHLIERMRNSASGFSLIGEGLFSGGRLVDWLQNSSEYSHQTSLDVAQQLLDLNLIACVDPSHHGFEESEVMYYQLEGMERRPSPRKEGGTALLRNVGQHLLLQIFLEQCHCAHLSFLWCLTDALLKNTIPMSRAIKLSQRYIGVKPEVDIPWKNSSTIDKIAALGNLDDKIKDKKIRAKYLDLIQMVQKDLELLLDEHHIPRFLQSGLTLKLGETLPALAQDYLLNKMKDPTQLAVTDTPAKGYIYLQSFQGQDAVDWMLCHAPIDRKAACDILQTLQQSNPKNSFARLEVDFTFQDQEVPYILRPTKRKHLRVKSPKPKRHSMLSPFLHLSETSPSMATSPPEIFSPSVLRSQSLESPMGSSVLRRRMIRKTNSRALIIQNFEEYSSTAVELLSKEGASSKLEAFSMDLEETPTSQVKRPQSPIPAFSGFEDKIVDKASSEEDKEGGEDHSRTLTEAQLFNNNPKEGVLKMINGEEPTPKIIAQALHRNKFLNKQKLGEYLGEGNQDLIKVMHAFVEELDFRDLDFDIALRHLLYCFRLPGEAQKIDRILSKFASEYFNQNPGAIFGNADAAWALAFAVIMLNTDAHSAQVKKKMTREAFIHNCRGINDGQSFPPEFLSDIYERIVLDKIRMLEDGALYPDAIKKGWGIIKIMRGSKLHQKWKRRWFVLLPTELLSFRKPGEVNCDGRISLADIKWVPTQETEKKFCIELQTLSKEKEKPQRRFSIASPTTPAELNYVLSLPSERELQSWTKVLVRHLEPSQTTERASSF
eukprot:TRINITY_DN4326_c0_g1_i1.p1 TRINITY_DN4326_c0_g1~~TRINITY_DN4326_c0_g1_i1.p1  ORF type:complete len:978 (-),score=214.86 TRINITY_DN4326_c0_g1_i1:36-2969(-)